MAPTDLLLVALIQYGGPLLDSPFSSYFLLHLGLYGVEIRFTHFGLQEWLRDSTSTQGHQFLKGYFGFGSDKWREASICWLNALETKLSHYN